MEIIMVEPSDLLVRRGKAEENINDKKVFQMEGESKKCQLLAPRYERKGTHTLWEEEVRKT